MTAAQAKLAASQPVRIHEGLVGLMVAADQVRPHPQNPRNGDTDLIVESMQTNGIYRAIYAQKSSGYILAGNHTYAAALELGCDALPVVFLDVDDTAAAKVLLVDNRAADKGGYDMGQLLAVLEDLGEGELVGTGYSADDFDQLLGDVGLPAPIELPSDGVGSGEAALMEVMTWGYLQWKSTRVQITADEVARLDALFNDYVVEKGTPAGFGSYILGLQRGDDQPVLEPATGEDQ